MSIRELKEEILKKYVSVHAFCKAHRELSRASVYLVLSGKYPGKAKKQIDRILDALRDAPAERRERLAVTQETLTDALQSIRCANCRRLNRRECMACRSQTAKESTELYERLFIN